MVQLRVRVTETLPAASVANAENVCPPSASPLYVTEAAQDANGAPSSEHEKVTGSSEESEKVAVVAVVTVPFVMALVIVIAGLAVSMVHVYEAGALRFIALSSDHAVNVCVPSASVPVVTGLRHGSGTPASRAHSYQPDDWFELNVKVADVAVVTGGGVFVRVATGGVVSTVHLRGVVPFVPSTSVAVTTNEWLPFDRPLALKWPLLQTTAVAASSLHLIDVPGFRASFG